MGVGGEKKSIRVGVLGSNHRSLFSSSAGCVVMGGKKAENSWMGND